MCIGSRSGGEITLRVPRVFDSLLWYQNTYAVVSDIMANVYEPYTPVLHAHVIRGLSSQALFDPGQNPLIRAPVGTGSYRVESFVPNETLVLVRRNGAAAHLERIRMVLESDSDVAITHALAGAFDVVDSPAVPSVVAHHAEIAERFEIHEILDLRRVYLLWNTRRPLLARPDVRRALTAAIDRDVVLPAEEQRYRRATACLGACAP